MEQYFPYSSRQYGSKLDGRVGGSVFSKDSPWEPPFGPLVYFQDISAIIQTAEWLHCSLTHDIFLFGDI